MYICFAIKKAFLFILEREKKNECGRCFVFAGMLRLLLGGLDFLPESEANEHTVKRSGMTTVRLILAQLAVKLAQRYVGIPSVIILDPLDLLLGMSVRVGRMRTVRLGHKRFPRAIILLIPPHQRGF